VLGPRTNFCRTVVAALLDPAYEAKKFCRTVVAALLDPAYEAK